MASEAGAAWPMEKMKKALERPLSQDFIQLAVLIVTGSLSPVTIGHLHMLRQARARLEEAGYAVVGGWLSPWGDGEATEKAQARGLPALSCALRLHLAELATQDEELFSVARWEASAPGRGADHLEAVRDLQRELAAVLPDLERPISVFLVCGSDNRRAHVGLLASQQQGLVVVPRRGIDTILEKPADRVFVAEPAPGRLDNLNGLRLCEALRNGDTVYVQKAVPAAAARLLLDPSPEEQAEFAADLERLSMTAASSGPWPCTKFAERLQAEPLEPGKVVAVLVACGSMSPAHRGHTLMLHRAKARLEDAGYAVLSAWLSPAGGERALREARAKKAAELCVAFRQKVAELSVCDDSFISVSSCEVGAKPRETAQALQEHLLRHFHYSLEGISLKTFYVCGSDVALQQSLQNGFQAQQDLGVVIVPRADDDEVFMDSPHHMVFAADPLDGEAAALSSTRLRAAIKAGDVGAATRAMSVAASRFVLAPTATEYAEMREDFDELGVSLPGASELVKTQGMLKVALKSWADPSGSIGGEDLRTLLRMLDPSWTNQELDALLSQACDKVDGRVNSDGFVDWIFSLQATAAA